MKLIQRIKAKFNTQRQNRLILLPLILLTFSPLSHAGFDISIHRQSNTEACLIISGSTTCDTTGNSSDPLDFISGTNVVLSSLSERKTVTGTRTLLIAGVSAEFNGPTGTHLRLNNNGASDDFELDLDNSFDFSTGDLLQASYSGTFPVTDFDAQFASIDAGALIPTVLLCRASDVDGSTITITSTPAPSCVAPPIGGAVSASTFSSFNMLAMLSALLLMIAFFMFPSRKEQV